MGVNKGIMNKSGKVKGVSILLFLGLSGCNKIKSDPPQQIGRFQICQGHYEVLGPHSVLEYNTPFKIDTVTGKVWMFRKTFGGQLSWEETES